MPKDNVSREHGIFFLENKAYVVMRVARSMDCTDSWPLYPEDLTIFDREFVLRRAFVDAIGEVWILPNKVGYPTGMIAVPVCQEYTG